MRGAAIALALLCGLAGCTTAGPPPPAALIMQASDDRPRLWYLGLGLYDESWSENDVAQLPEVLERDAPGFHVMPVVLSNHETPFGPGTVEQVIGDIARNAGPNDVILVYASTHGAPGLLGRSAGGEQLEPVGIGEVQGWLVPLRDHDTVLVLSACFSGSFVPALRGPHRIIFTAARADRTSFGCQAGAEHTVFGDALLQAFARPRESLRVIVAATRATVTARERELGVTSPSQPQLSVGDAVTRLFDAPVF